MRSYIVTWMDDSCGIMSTTTFNAKDLQEAMREAYEASYREDGIGAIQVNIEVSE